MKKSLSFDDTLLVPKYSEIRSRSDVDTSAFLSESIELTLPVISSPMDTVTELNMAKSMSSAGGLGIIHRYNSVEEQAKIVFDVYTSGVKHVAAAIGMTGDFLERAQNVVDSGANILCIDVAHGHHVMMRDALSSLKNKFGRDVHLMAGNVATLEAFDDLASWGADSVRVGIGGGSICSTRLVSGHGVPTLQSVIDCARTAHEIPIVADGGFKTSGDIIKALAAGADFVMLGSMLAGTKETPGQVFTSADGSRYKVYRGMASSNAQKDWRGKSSTPEGVSSTVAYRGPVAEVLRDIAGGIRSGLSYSGCTSIRDLQLNCEFTTQTSAGQSESGTHILWRDK
tara:strand:+ start:567 stop:1589 length:1023 start_codon:yes stop_codon:yes gene_type:complete